MKRSRCFILWICLCIFSINVYGQASSSSIGITAGLGLRSNSFENSAYYGAGGYFGILGGIPLNRILSLTPALVYSFKGFRHVESGLFSGLEEKQIADLNYLDLQLPLQVRLEDFVHFRAGIQIGWLLNAKFEYYDGFSTYDASITSDAESFDFGILAGPVFQLKNGLGFSAIVNLGLNDVSDKYLLKKNFLGTVGIHYLFALKRNGRDQPVRQ